MRSKKARNGFLVVPALKPLSWRTPTYTAVPTPATYAPSTTTTSSATTLTTIATYHPVRAPSCRRSRYPQLASVLDYYYDSYYDNRDSEPALPPVNLPYDDDRAL